MTALLGLILLLTMAVDQLSKIYARAHFQDAGTIRVLGDFFVIHYAENNGSFLSLGSGLPEPWKWILLTAIPVLVLIYFIAYTLFSADLKKAERITLTVIISGGLSNIVDRILFEGWVTDFLHFSLWGPLRTGILNIADMYITFGVILFLYMQFKKEGQRTATAAAAPESEGAGAPMDDDLP